MTRYRAWLPLSDARVRCPKGHVFKPHAQLHRGSMVVRCGECSTGVIVVVTRGASSKLVAEICDSDLTSLAGLGAAGVLVYLLTTPLETATVA